MKRYLPYFSGITMATIFGFSFLFSKNALDTITVYELLFLRFLIASLLMTLLIVLKFIKIDFKGKSLKPILIVSIWQPVIYFLMENTGLKYTTSSEAGVMMACIPIIVAILGVFILKEIPTRFQIASIIISIAGVLILVLGQGNAGSSHELKGILFLMAAVFSAAMYNIFSRKASLVFTPIEITYIMMVIGTIAFGIMYVINGVLNSQLNIISRLNSSSISAVLYLGILSSVGAFLLANYTLSKLQAAQSSVFANLTTVVSVIAGVCFRNESFETYKILGALLIIVGVFGTNYFVKFKNGEPKELASAGE